MSRERGKHGDTFVTRYGDREKSPCTTIWHEYVHGGTRDIIITHKRLVVTDNKFNIPQKGQQHKVIVVPMYSKESDFLQIYSCCIISHDDTKCTTPPCNGDHEILSAMLLSFSPSHGSNVVTCKCHTKNNFIEVGATFKCKTEEKKCTISGTDRKQIKADFYINNPTFFKIEPSERKSIKTTSFFNDMQMCWLQGNKIDTNFAKLISDLKRETKLYNDPQKEKATMIMWCFVCMGGTYDIIDRLVYMDTNFYPFSHETDIISKKIIENYDSLDMVTEVRKYLINSSNNFCFDEYFNCVHAAKAKVIVDGLTEDGKEKFCMDSSSKEGSGRRGDGGLPKVSMCEMMECEQTITLSEGETLTVTSEMYDQINNFWSKDVAESANIKLTYAILSCNFSDITTNPKDKLKRYYTHFEERYIKMDNVFYIELIKQMNKCVKTNPDLIPPFLYWSGALNVEKFNNPISDISEQFTPLYYPSDLKLLARPGTYYTCVVGGDHWSVLQIKIKDNIITLNMIDSLYDNTARLKTCVKGFEQIIKSVKEYYNPTEPLSKEENTRRLGKHKFNDYISITVNSKSSFGKDVLKDCSVIQNYTVKCGSNTLWNEQSNVWACGWHCIFNALRWYFNGHKQPNIPCESKFHEHHVMKAIQTLLQGGVDAAGRIEWCGR